MAVTEVTPIPCASPATLARQLTRRAQYAEWSRAPSTAPAWLPVNAACAIACVTSRTLRRWVRAGLVRASRPGDGGRVLINRDSLLGLIEAHATGPAR